MDQQAYRKLISGQSEGLGAEAILFALEMMSEIYAKIIRCRNFLYAKGWLKTKSVNAKVFSIGNITTGGTGKTPLVIWIYEFLQQKGFNCAILTRGYKANKISDFKSQISNLKTQNLKLKTQNYNDEPMILAKSCPNAKVIINANRAAGAKEAVDKFGAKALIMDDGFQHRRLERDMDIIAIDATMPFGFGRLLPAGLLREPVSSLHRADAAVITRCDQAAGTQLDDIEDKLRMANVNMVIARSIHKAVCVKMLDKKEASLDELKGKSVFAFCGIGNPEAFIQTIQDTGAHLAGSKIYDDHYNYTEKDISAIYRQAENLQAEMILSTQKDWTKTALLAAGKEKMPFGYLAIKLQFINGEQELKELIEKVLAGKIVKKQ